MSKRKPPQEVFVEAVLARCRVLGWTDMCLARQAGISKGHWSEIRNYKKCPSLDSVVKIAKAVDLELSYTFTEP